MNKEQYDEVLKTAVDSLDDALELFHSIGEQLLGTNVLTVAIVMNLFESTIKHHNPGVYGQAREIVEQFHKFQKINPKG